MADRSAGQNKEPATVRAAFLKIVNRAGAPGRVDSDNGNEWKGVFATLLKEKGVAHSFKGRTNHVAVVDRKIQSIKQHLYSRMAKTTRPTGLSSSTKQFLL